MTARARKPNESFTAYRASLKDEERHLRHYLKGRMVHVSAELVPITIATGLTTWRVKRPGITYRRAA